MSLSAALVLAAAISASAQTPETAHGVVLARATATATILPSAAVRQASGLVGSGDNQPQHQIRRRGRTVLVEFQ
jgi:hypothetical protein